MNIQEKNQEKLHKQLFITVAVLILYKLAIFITVPGINKDILEMLVGKTDAFAMSSIISGGAITKFSFLALGIMPYITASIVIQLVIYMEVIPKLNEWKKQGSMGQASIKKATIVSALVLSAFQATAVAVGLGKTYPGIYLTSSTKTYIIVAGSLFLGTVVLLIASEIIERKGIGNGISILIFANILMGTPSLITMYYTSVIQPAGEDAFIAYVKTAGVITLIFSLLYLLVFIHLSERRVPIQPMVRRSSNFATNKNSTYLPFKLISVGVIPVILASAIIMMPTVFAQIFNEKAWSSFVIKYFAMTSLTGGLLYAVLIIMLAFFYTFMQLNPKDLAKNLSQGQMFVPSLKPGNETAIYFETLLKRLTLVGGLILAFVALVPVVLAKFLDLPLQIQISGISMIILVNVALDINKRIKNAQVVKEYKNYKGFNRKTIKKI